MTVVVITSSITMVMTFKPFNIALLSLKLTKRNQKVKCKPISEEILAGLHQFYNKSILEKTEIARYDSKIIGRRR